MTEKAKALVAKIKPLVEKERESDSSLTRTKEKLAKELEPLKKRLDTLKAEMAAIESKYKPKVSEASDSIRHFREDIEKLMIDFFDETKEKTAPCGDFNAQLSVSINLAIEEDNAKRAVQTVIDKFPDDRENLLIVSMSALDAIGALAGIEPKKKGFDFESAQKKLDERYPGFCLTKKYTLSIKAA